MYLHQLVAVALVASTPVAATSLSTRISINDGVIIGTTTTVPSATAVVNKYLGIPFAAPPERFSPPKPPCPWNHPLDASKFQATCTQQFDDMGPLRDLLVDVFNNPPLNESEDCLYINVYTPSSPTPEGGRAILAMIPGGAFQLGGAAQYDASALAAYEDIIVLSFNYRTNVFGFPSSPSLPPTQHNLGFLDQRLALSWIQNNIHFFGGDPEKVTITGGSAGAYSVDVLITSYPPNSHPPFRAALMQSGQYSFNAFPTDPSTSIQNWYNLTATLGCGNSTANGADLECVRKAPTAAIKEIIEQNILGFNPIPDNVTFFPNLAQRRAAGNFVRIPVISGTTAQEGRLFMYGFPFNVSTFIDTYFPEMDEGLKKEIEAAYPRGPGMETDYDIISQIYTEIVWQCPEALFSNSSASSSVPTWRYYYNASFPNLTPAHYSDLGVFHGSDIVLFFSPAELPSFPGANSTKPTTQEYALVRSMWSAFGSFVRDPEGGPGWNAIGTGSTYEGGAGDEDLGILGDVGSVKGGGITVVREAVVDSRCALFKPIYEALGGL